MRNSRRERDRTPSGLAIDRTIPTRESAASRACTRRAAAQPRAVCTSLPGGSSSTTRSSCSSPLRPARTRSLSATADSMWGGNQSPVGSPTTIRRACHARTATGTPATRSTRYGRRATQPPQRRHASPRAADRRRNARPQSTRFPSHERLAGRSVTAISTAMATVNSPPTPTDRSSFTGMARSPANPTATARPDSATVCPACRTDRKSTRLNSSHQISSYAVFCLKNKKTRNDNVLPHVSPRRLFPADSHHHFVRVVSALLHLPAHPIGGSVYLLAAPHLSRRHDQD